MGRGMKGGVQVLETKWWKENKSIFDYITDVSEFLGDVKEQHLSKHEWSFDDLLFRDCFGIYLCRIEQSYRSIEVLLYLGHTDDCFALLRKMYEAIISLAYLSTDSRGLSRQCMDYELVYTIRLLQFRRAITDHLSDGVVSKLDRIFSGQFTEISQFVIPNQAQPKCGKDLLELKYCDNWTKIDLATLASRVEMTLAYQTTIKFCNGYVHPRSTLPQDFIRRDNLGYPIAFDANPNPDYNDIHHIARDTTLGLLKVIELIYPIVDLEPREQHAILLNKWNEIFFSEG